MLSAAVVVQRGKKREEIKLEQLQLANNFYLPSHDHLARRKISMLEKSD